MATPRPFPVEPLDPCAYKGSTFVRTRVRPFCAQGYDLSAYKGQRLLRTGAEGRERVPQNDSLTN